MTILQELKKIKDLSNNTKLLITFTDGDTLCGYYRGYTNALDNDPEIPMLDLMGDDGIFYGIFENEISSIQLYNS